MVAKSTRSTGLRIPLTKARILAAAIDLADSNGLDALTMRNLAHTLDVEAMSLYHHIANKDALLDGVVDAVVDEIEEELGGFAVTSGRSDWRAALRSRILTARQVMLRHRWAPGVIETRTSMTPTLLRYMDGVLGVLIEGGFTNDQAHHAMHALGSRALGFNQELFVPDDSNQGDQDGETLLADLAPQLPYLVGMLADISHNDPDSTLGWCDDQTEFEFGLDLLLNGLEQQLAED